MIANLGLSEKKPGICAEQRRIYLRSASIVVLRMRLGDHAGMLGPWDDHEEWDGLSGPPKTLWEKVEEEPIMFALWGAASFGIIAFMLWGVIARGVCHGSPAAITTDGLGSYKAAMRDLGNGEKQQVGRRISPANSGPNLFHHIRTVSWQMSMPRSNSRSSTFRSESGKRTYIITTKRITSGEELKQRNGLGGLGL